MAHKLLLTLALLLTTATSHATEKLPLEDFFKKPKYAGFQLSPSGTHIAVLAPINGRQNLAVIDLETRQPRATTAVKHQDVNGFMWANNDRLLFFMDKDGSESFGIFAVDKDGKRARTLVETLESQVKKGQRVIRFTRVLDPLVDDDDFVLVINNERRASYPDVYRMNVMNGRKSLVLKNPGNVTGWITDWEGEVVGANYVDGISGGFQIYNKETKKWEEYTRYRYDEPGYSLTAITGDGVNAYVTSYIDSDGNSRDKSGLFRYNLKTRKIGELIYEHPEIDCCGPMLSRKKKDIVGVSFMVSKPEFVYLDPEWKSMMEGINAALPDTMNAVSSLTRDETTAVIVSTSSTQPARYFLFDTNKRVLETIGESRPWIKAAEMAEMKPVSFNARDGLKMHGYLTLPAASNGKNLPLVMNPHGGPWARDGYGFNPGIQFLANRGYAVLQVNFRGSTGFGMNHWLSSRKQWGQTMQDDITDAVNWAIEQGYADPDKVCIFGGSYGGYATMAGLTFSPDLYKCGINYVGVTDLPLLFKTAPDAWASGMESMMELVGNPETEKEFLEEWSPSNHADKIKVPVFMAYGAQDPRVDLEHAKIMEKAMRKNGVDYELMIKYDEGHGYRKEENVFDFYSKIESFLDENI